MNNMWKKWRKQIIDTQLVIWYERSLDMNPIAEYLHPGLFPIGSAFSDDPRHNFPNLDWIIMHYAYLGVRSFIIVSEDSFTGLQNYYLDFRGLNIRFINNNLLTFLNEIDKLSSIEKYSMIVSGYLFSNADFYAPMIYHLQHECEVTLITFRGLKYNVGLVKFEKDNLVSSFKEKPIDKSKLVNSNILIISNDKIKNLNISSLFESYNPDISSINQFIHHIKNNLTIKNFELQGIDDQPLWVMNLSSIEAWIKLDIDNFLNRYNFLLQ